MLSTATFVALVADGYLIPGYNTVLIIGIHTTTVILYQLIHSVQDGFLGVHIAANSLANDLWQITGFLRDATTGGPSNITSQWNNGTMNSAIIAGSTNSSPIRQKTGYGILSTADIEGKWEMFKTGIVENLLSQV